MTQIIYTVWSDDSISIYLNIGQSMIKITKKQFLLIKLGNNLKETVLDQTPTGTITTIYSLT